MENSASKHEIERQCIRCNKTGEVDKDLKIVSAAEIDFSHPKYRRPLTKVYLCIDQKACKKRYEERLK